MRKLVDRFNVDQLIADQQKSNAGFCLHNGEGQYLYYVPKECNYIGLRLNSLIGKKLIVTRLNPLTGQLSKPEEQTIPQWPTLKAPPGDRFHILIVEVPQTERSSDLHTGHEHQ